VSRGKGEKEQERAHGLSKTRWHHCLNSEFIQPEAYCPNLMHRKRRNVSPFSSSRCDLSHLACSVPVFRYALGALGGGCVSRDGSEGRMKLEGNFVVTTARDDQDRTAAPAFRCAMMKSIWSADYTEANAKQMLVDSPARREIAERLANGESAVWVLLECGDKAKDDAAAKFLDERLEYLGGVMELPALDAAGHQKRPRFDSGRRLAARLLHAASEAR
jgi:hypothetical protein